MKVINKIIKGISTFFYLLWVDIQLYCFSMLIVSPIIALVLTAYNIFSQNLPVLLSEKLWLLWIIVALPVAFYFIVKTWVDTIRNRKKSK